ncbi:hypothetical protein [Lolliginicoccus levis]|uniref:hypothetical protein n=1 Tax=Lolliginicoccus levis TaxID=2919542 RepID=UPI00241E008F|nr:hypothetical protein [Lolliginicoccus levis]
MTPSAKHWRRTTITKTVLALLSAAILGAACFLLYISYTNTSEVSKNETRGLIIIATEGGNKPGLTLNVDQYYEFQKPVKLVFYFTADDINNVLVDSVDIDYTIAFAGSSFVESVTCAQDQPTLPTNFGMLPEGIQIPILYDAQGGPYSAINHLGQEMSGGVAEDRVFTSVHSGRLRVVKQDEYIRHRKTYATNGGQVVFAESCELGMSTAWVDESVGNLLDLGSRRTLLPYQINWSGVDNRIDYHQNLRVGVSILRQPGWQLSEAYPYPAIDPVRWHDSIRTIWHNQGSIENSFAFTSQPVYIFTDRSRVDARELYLIVLGAILGVAGALLLSGASGIFDLFFRGVPQDATNDSTAQTLNNKGGRLKYSILAKVSDFWNEIKAALETDSRNSAKPSGDGGTTPENEDHRQSQSEE